MPLWEEEVEEEELSSLEEEVGEEVEGVFHFHHSWLASSWKLVEEEVEVADHLEVEEVVGEEVSQSLKQPRLIIRQHSLTIATEA